MAANTNIIKRALRVPAQAPAHAKEIFKQIVKLNPVRDVELLELRDNYEGDHAKLIDAYVQKPPPWDDTTWNYVKRGLMHINSTRTSLRILSSGVYGGAQFRRVESEKGPFRDQLNSYVASPEWRAAMKRLMREMTLYGTSYVVPSYDRERRKFSLRHLNPVTTHILTSTMDPDVPLAVAEFCENRNWVRIWTQDFYAVLARDEADVEFLDWSDEEGKAIELPYFPVLVAKAEDVPMSPYGLSQLRDTPRFNRALAVSYFNVSFSSLMKAQAMLTIATDDGATETDTPVTQIGPHTALVLPKGAVAEFISSNADVASLMDVIEKLQDLESYVLGIPSMRAQKNSSAESSRLEATPLTSQVSDGAGCMMIVETRGIQLLAAVGHWEVDSPASPEDVERLYDVSVRITPSINVESLGERVTALTSLARDGVVPEEDVVATFSNYMPFAQVQAQAEVMRERRSNQVSKSAEPPPSKEE